MSDIGQIFVALIVLALVTIFVANGQGAGFIGAAGNFLVNMVNKVNGK